MFQFPGIFAKIPVNLYLYIGTMTQFYPNKLLRPTILPKLFRRNSIESLEKQRSEAEQPQL